jgi:hypothetical protein
MLCGQCRGKKQLAFFDYRFVHARELGFDYLSPANPKQL